MSIELNYHRNKNIKIFLYTATPLFILSLISGPLIPDLFVVLVSIFFIILYFKEYRDKLNVNNFVKILFIFYIYIFFNSFFSAEKFLSLKSSIPFFRFIIFAIAISFLIEDKKFKYLIYYSFLFIYVILFFDSIFQLYFGKNILGFPYMNNRISSFFGDELILGSFISKTVAILLFLLFNLKFNYKIFHYISIILIGIVLVILSAERTSLFILIIIVFFSLFYLKLYQVFYILLILSVATAFTLIINKTSYERLVDHTLKQSILDGKFNYPSYRHQLHFLSAFKIYQDNKIFGSGLKTFRVLCKQYPYSLEEKIKKDNLVLSKFDGTILISEDKDRVLIGIFSDNQLKSQLFQKYITDRYRGFDNFYNGLTSYVKVNPSYIIDKNFYYKAYAKDFEKIKINQKIFSMYEYSNGCNTHPHNFYLQFLAELGIIGLLFLIGTYIYVIYIVIMKLLTKFRRNKISSDFILYVNYMAVLFPLIPSGNFFNNYLCLLIFLPLCMYKLCYIK